MKGREIRLVNQLRKNSRRSITEMAINIEMHLSTVFKVFNRLYKENTIVKNACLIDFTKLEFPFKVGIFLTTCKKGELKRFLADHPNLNTFFRLSGDFGYYAEFLFKDMVGYKDLIDELNDSELVKKMSVHFVTDVKQEEFIIGGDDDEK